MAPFDPKVYRNLKDGIGMPADDIATDTTQSWTVVALLKGIAGKLGVGTATSVASDVAQGSTTAGQTGGLVQGAVTTAAPTYVTGKTNPISLKTNGDLRVVDTDAVAQLVAANATLSTLNLNTDTLEAELGLVTETAPATDTASSGLNGRLQRIAQRITSLIAQIPATLGVKARTASLSVALSTEDAALFPASLGQKTMANSFAVTVASDQTALAVSASAATGGIASTSRIVSAAATTNATSAKASAGRVYAVQGYNASAAVRYLKLYNKASAPTVGTDTPVKTIAIPAGSVFALDWPLGYSFATGIAYALTTGSADADTGALTAGDILGLNVDYT